MTTQRDLRIACEPTPGKRPSKRSSHPSAAAQKRIAELHIPMQDHVVDDKHRQPLTFTSSQLHCLHFEATPSSSEGGSVATSPPSSRSKSVSAIGISAEVPVVLGTSVKWKGSNGKEVSASIPATGDKLIRPESKGGWASLLKKGLTLHIVQGSRVHVTKFTYLSYDPFGKVESSCPVDVPLTPRQPTSKEGKRSSDTSVAESMGLLEFEASTGGDAWSSSLPRMEMSTPSLSSPHNSI
ncbi:hypothetical protein CBS101457_004808 [Exobasidium rhododendri]|nr:hypothetical protein CBS101457_004808 [Exobasidium rhododendri]